MQELPVRGRHWGCSDRGVLFGLGASVYDWNDPFGRLSLQTLAMVAEFEANLGHLRTREGMALAKRNGKLKGKQPKLPEPARRSIRRRYATGEVSLADLATEYLAGLFVPMHRGPARGSDGRQPSATGRLGAHSGEVHGPMATRSGHAISSSETQLAEVHVRPRFITCEN